MSIKIHYGPNGSYKTSGAIQDDMIPAWLAGRTIVTNVRGVSRDRFQAQGLDPNDEGGEIIWCDGDTLEGKNRIASFHHWAPVGSLIFVDEASSVWPKHQKDILLPFPDGPEEADRLDRPRDFFHAFEMHRHWNWDLVLTTPNIAKIRPEIRECADGAFKHKNQALIGIKGRYLEAVHSPMETGQNERDFTSVNSRKISSYVFDCYDSTKTGVVSDTISGRAFWKNPRVLVLAFVLLVALWFGFRSGLPSLSHKRNAPVVAGVPVPAAPRADASMPVVYPAKTDPTLDAYGSVYRVPASTAPSGGVGSSPDRALGFASRVLGGQELQIGGSVSSSATRRRVYLFWLVSQGREPRQLYSRDLEDMGFTLEPRGDCLVVLHYGSETQHVFCVGNDRASSPTSAGGTSHSPASADVRVSSGVAAPDRPTFGSPLRGQAVRSSS